ncbi:hypothetical protein R6Q59_036815 [Mikania micrantha]|uniref:RING-type E3 ubiquitin transferase n=1 Tax=Mikania micrantha TaxID=192012 RepID=A0A5N6N982_9ASTR|nr:hypothetical protein E3N88_21885 [Mikania micrantha]
MVPAMAYRRLQQTDILTPPSAATGNTSSSGSYKAKDDNFENNMMIILAILLCALICALGLNSIVRCFFRCRTFPFENIRQTTSRIALTNRNQGRLSEIPVVVYRSQMKTSSTDCPICLGEFSEGEKMRILPKCNHLFHVKCIDKWLMSHSSCPICRQLLFELDVV